MYQKVSRSSFWQIAKETKQYINSLFNKRQASPPSRQHHSQSYSRHHLHEKVPHSITVSCINITTACHSPLTSPVSSIDYDPVQETVIRYDSLWEIQLALGEIPGMFEGNILQPCQPRDQPQPPQQPQNRHTDNYQRLIQLSYQQYTFPGTVSLSSISETLNKDEGYSDYAQASDENSGWSHDHCSQWYTLYQQDKIEIRHDRKDSGVFVHDEEGVFSQISSNSKVIDHDFEAPEWHTTDFDDCEFDYGNMTIESRALALRSCPVGEDFFQMEIGSLMLPLPSFPRPLPLLS